MEEKNFLTSGTKLTRFSFSNYFGLVLICYDLRFPELVRNVFHKFHPDFLIYLANWPSPRGEHWDLLLKTRAIENQTFVFAVNRVGKDKFGEYYGHSQIIDPMGQVLTPLSHKEEYITWQGDIEGKLKEVRSKFNIHKDFIDSIEIDFDS